MLTRRWQAKTSLSGRIISSGMERGGSGETGGPQGDMCECMSRPPCGGRQAGLVASDRTQANNRSTQAGPDRIAALVGMRKELHAALGGVC